MNDNLFEDELIEKKELERKLYGLSVAFLIFSFILTVYELRSAYMVYTGFSVFSASAPMTVRVHAISGTVALALYAILIPLQAYFFYRFADLVFKGTHADKSSFREGLRWLVRQGVVLVVLFGANALWAIVDWIFF